jgi:hypothetical protein
MAAIMDIGRTITSKNIGYLSFYACLISFNIMSSRLIHAATNFIISMDE